MEVVVTGAAGYIGSHIVHELLQSGHKVVGIDNLSTGKRSFLEEGIDFYQGDIEERKFLHSVFDSLTTGPINVGVIHAAGLKFAGDSVNRPLEFYRANTSGVEVLLSTMKEFNLKSLVFSSSSSVYGNLEKPEPVKEHVSLNPVSPYGRSKLFAEQIIQDFVAASDFRAVSFRYFNVVGNGSIRSFDTSRFNLFPNLYRVVGSKDPISVFGSNYPTKDGSCIRDYVDVTLLARVHVVALQKMLIGVHLKQVYNLGSGSGFSVLEVVSKVKQIIDSALVIQIEDGRLGDPAQILADISAAQNDLGWQHNVTLEEMILSGWKAWQLNR